MSKKILLLLIFFPCLANAQYNFKTWQTIPLVDEFGDETGQKTKAIFGQGTFSNSATSNSELIVKAIDYNVDILIELYEYGNGPAVTYNDITGFIKVKRANGDIEDYEFYGSEEGLYFDTTKPFGLLMKSGKKEELKIVLDESEFSRSRSKYLFTIRTQ